MPFRYLHTKGPKDPRRLIVKQKGYGPNWSKQKKKALERDNYTCQKCGRTGKQKGKYWDVHCHHIRKIKYFANSQTKEIDYQSANDLSNLITLCSYGCHKYADGHQNNSGFVQL